MKGIVNRWWAAGVTRLDAALRSSHASMHVKRGDVSEGGGVQFP